MVVFINGRSGISARSSSPYTFVTLVEVKDGKAREPKTFYTTIQIDGVKSLRFGDVVKVIFDSGESLRQQLVGLEKISE